MVGMDVRDIDMIKHRIVTLAKKFKTANLNMYGFYKYFDKVCAPVEKITKCGSMKDCSPCCHQNVNMSLNEYHFMNTARLSKDVLPMDNDHRKKNKIACQMLKDTKCSDYERRPIGCRMYLTTDNPSLCAAFKMDIVASEPMLVAVSAWRTHERSRVLKNFEQWKGR